MMFTIVNLLSSAAATNLYKPNDVSKCSLEGIEYKQKIKPYHKILTQMFKFVTLTLGQQQHPDDVK